MAAIVLVVVGWGTLGERDPASPTDGAADGPHIDDSGALVLAAQFEADGWKISWTPRPGSQPTGAIGAIPSPTTQVAEAPTIDLSGEWVASPDCDGSGCDLVITLADDRMLQLTSLPARDHVWHSDEAATIAWIGGGETETTVRTGSIDDTIEFRPDELGIGVSATAELLRWDEHGFVLIDGAETRALDPNGDSAWSTDGIVLDATSNVIIVEHRDGTWSILDRIDGTVLAEGSTSEPGVRLTTGRIGEVVSTSVDGEIRHTFAIDGPPEEASVRGSRVIPLDGIAGAEYRLLRSQTGDRFTVHVAARDGSVGP